MTAEPTPESPSPVRSDVRLFFAVELGPEVRERVADLASRLQKAAVFTPVRLSWVKKENYHVTLFFLGEIPRGRADKLARILPDVARGIAGFNLDIRHLGTFPQTGHTPPKVLWMDCHRVAPELIKLREQCGTAILRAGLKLPEQDFSPHVTIARFKSTKGLREFGRLMKDYIHYKAGKCPVTRIVLMESRTGGGEATYVPYASALLDPPADPVPTHEEEES